MTARALATASRFPASSTRLMGILALLFVALLLGFGNVVQKPLLTDGDPWMVMALRASLAVLVLLPLAKGEWRTVRQQQYRLPPVMWLVVASFALGMGLQTVGAKYTTATNLGFLINAYVIFMPLLVWLSGQARPKALAIMASLTCFAGAGLLSGGSISAFGFGDLLCLGAAFAYAVWVLALSRLGAGASVMSFLVLLQWLPVAVLGFAVTPASWLDIARHLHGHIAAYVMLGVFASALGFLLAARAQQKVSACCASVIYATEGVFGGLAAYLVLGERLSGAAILGAALIVGSIVVAACERAPPSGAAQSPR
jgi:drug/metabolite transporter (DMT)-like permease